VQSAAEGKSAGDKLREVAEQAEREEHHQNDGGNHPATALARLGCGRWRDDRRRLGKRRFIHNARKLTQSGQCGKVVWFAGTAAPVFISLTKLHRKTSLGKYEDRVFLPVAGDGRPRSNQLF